MTERHQDPQVGDVLVMPGRHPARVVKDVNYYVTYTYWNAKGAHQRVSARKHVWLAAVRKALREGGGYIPNPERPGEG